MMKNEKRFVVLWAVGLGLLYCLSGYSGLKIVRAGTAASKAKQAHLQSPTQPEKVSDSPAAAQPVDVLVGVSVNHAGEFDLKQSAWTADFNLWFLWNHETVTPGESFNLVNGEVVQKTVRESYQNGTEHYIEYHIVARMKMDFDPTRFPFGAACLPIRVEDATRGTVAVRYVADEQHSGISPSANARAATVRSFQVRTGTSDDSSRPVNRAAGGKPASRSEFTAEAWVVPEGLGIYRRMFQALFASVAVALIALYIKPTWVDCRFGLPVGGFFASVSNNIFVGSMLPFADRPTLTDMINATSLMTIFLILVQSVISLYIFDSLGRERLSQVFDRVSLAIFLLGYLTLNLALPLAARSQ